MFPCEEIASSLLATPLNAGGAMTLVSLRSLAIFRDIVHSRTLKFGYFVYIQVPDILIVTDQLHRFVYIFQNVALIPPFESAHNGLDDGKGHLTEPFQLLVMMDAFLQVYLPNGIHER